MRDLIPVLDVLAAAEEARDAETVRRAVLNALARLVPYDRVAWTETPDGGDTVVSGSPHRLHLVLPAVPGTVVRISLYRAAVPFDEGERALAARLRPVLTIAAREAVLRNDAHPLTSREAQILRCVVRGESNAEVALSLAISPRTVEKHLEHVYRKLGVTGRYAAIASARSSSVSP